jgi:hypothetical protein
MDKWLEIPTDRVGLPVGRLCIILALTIMLLLAQTGRQATLSSDGGVGQAVRTAGWGP